MADIIQKNKSELFQHPVSQFQRPFNVGTIFLPILLMVQHGIK